VDNTLTFQGEAETEQCSGDPEYNWSLRSAPEGARSWSATGRQASFIPNIAGDYILKLDVTADATGQGSAEHKLTVTAGQSRPGEVQEFAFILGKSDSQLRAFPSKLVVSAGTLRFFLTSLDQIVTVVIRREGAQAGVATVLVEPGKLAIIEAELSPGIYELVPQGEDVVLGRIEAR
jgi:hypothetical protein